VIKSTYKLCLESSNRRDYLEKSGGNGVWYEECS